MEHWIWLLSTLNSAYMPTIYLWKVKEWKYPENLQKWYHYRTDYIETQRIKCFIPHKLGQISGLLPDHVFSLVFSSFPSIGGIKGYSPKHLLQVDKIIFCKCVAGQTIEWSSLGSTALLAILSLGLGAVGGAGVSQGGGWGKKQNKSKQQ